MLRFITKPCLFYYLALDFVGQIHPASYNGHRFVLVDIDYFTKWTEAVPLKKMTHKGVIHFILGHIVHRFGIPQTLTTDQGSSFMTLQVHEFSMSLQIKLLRSSPTMLRPMVRLSLEFCKNTPELLQNYILVPIIFTFMSLFNFL
jgi:hypothetical protein